MTYNDEEDHDVPARIDKVHLPSDVGEADGHEVYQDETDLISHHITGQKVDSRGKGVEILLDRVSVRPNGIVEDLRRI